MLQFLSPKLIEEFCFHLRFVEGKSPLTLLSYRRDLNQYKVYKDSPSQELFQEYLQQKGLKTSSQRRAISAVRSYFRFLENKEYSVDFQETLSLPANHTSLPCTVHLKEFEKMLKACRVLNKEEHTHRNQLVLLFLFGLACRVSELVNVNVSDYIDSDESIIITGKGNKQRILPVTEPLLTHLRHYIQSSRNILIRPFSKNTPALFLNNRGRRPSRVDVWRWLERWSKKARLSTKSPHQFRHGCATALLDNGVDLRSIQKLLGHSSIETTKIYTKVSPQKMREAIQSHHPLSKVHE